LSSAAEPEYLTRDEINSLRDSMTMLDVFRARKNPDKEEAGLMAFYETAKRLALVGPEASLEEFLVRLRAQDFNSIMREPGISRAGVPNSPRPVNGGELEPDFSDSTDSDLETSSSSP
jgi:hypothetical protein